MRILSWGRKQGLHQLCITVSSATNIFSRRYTFDSQVRRQIDAALTEGWPDKRALLCFTAGAELARSVDAALITTSGYSAVVQSALQAECRIAWARVWHPLHGTPNAVIRGIKGSQLTTNVCAKSGNC